MIKDYEYLTRIPEDKFGQTEYDDINDWMRRLALGSTTLPTMKVDLLKRIRDLRSNVNNVAITYKFRWRLVPDDLKHDIYSLITSFKGDIGYLEQMLGTKTFKHERSKEKIGKFKDFLEL